MNIVGNSKYNTIDFEQMSKCLKKNIKIYPVFSPTKDTYTENKVNKGGKKYKTTLRMVIPEVNMDGNIIRFDSVQLEDKFGQIDFRQDEVHYVISKLYEAYAKRIN